MSKAKNPGNRLGESVAKPAPEMDDYETKDHFNTLQRAHEIQGDDAKMEKVRKLAGRHSKFLDGLKAPVAPKKAQNVGDLKRIYAKKFGAK